MPFPLCLLCLAGPLAPCPPYCLQLCSHTGLTHKAAPYTTLTQWRCPLDTPTSTSSSHAIKKSPGKVDKKVQVIMSSDVGLGVSGPGGVAAILEKPLPRGQRGRLRTSQGDQSVPTPTPGSGLATLIGLHRAPPLSVQLLVGLKGAALLVSKNLAGVDVWPLVEKQHQLDFLHCCTDQLQCPCLPNSLSSVWPILKGD